MLKKESGSGTITGKVLLGAGIFLITLISVLVGVYVRSKCDVTEYSSRKGQAY